jgi:hypothetical protein
MPSKSIFRYLHQGEPNALPTMKKHWFCLKPRSIRFLYRNPPSAFLRLPHRTTTSPLYLQVLGTTSLRQYASSLIDTERIPQKPEPLLFSKKFVLWSSGRELSHFVVGTILLNRKPLPRRSGVANFKSRKV